MAQLTKVTWLLEPGETALILTKKQYQKILNALSDAETYTGLPYTQLINEVQTINCPTSPKSPTF